MNYEDVIINGVNVGPLPPTFETYKFNDTFFGGDPPLDVSVGYIIVLGFGIPFSLLTTALVCINAKFGNSGELTSEHFNTAGRTVKTGLTAAVIVAQWTWAATLLQSSNVAWLYGVSGPFWYASGATIQVILFGVLAINVKKVSPSAHTVCEIVRARWGRNAHLTFLFFCFSANIIVSSMLLLGGAATVEALTGMKYELASFFIPWGVILYTASGGLGATFLANYLQTVVIYAVLIIMIFLVYVKFYSSDQIYFFLENTVSKTEEQCMEIYSDGNGTSFFVPQKYACGPVPGNQDGSYLTMVSSDGLMFGIINIVGNFGTVFMDQAYWQSAIAARPESASRGYFLGGICWFSIPFSLATSLGLASTALMLPITADESGAGLVPPAVATELLGNAGGVLILVMLFMGIVSTGSAELIAVSSLVAYDIYREYINPEANGDDILRISRIVIVAFGLFMGFFSLLLHALGLNLGWVYLFMGIVIGSGVFPLWNMMTWTKASGTGAIIAAWVGFVLAVTGWIIGAKVQSGEVSVASLGTNEVMLSGNLIAIISSGIIHYVYSAFVDPQDYDFAELDKHITLVEQDLRGLTDAEKDPVVLERAERWIKSRGYVLTLVLILIWPLLSVPAGVFSESYFAFWVLVALAWGFGAGIVIFIYPLIESSEEINQTLSNMYNHMTGKEPVQPVDTNLAADEKAAEDEKDVLVKGTETPPEKEEIAEEIVHEA